MNSKTTSAPTSPAKGGGGGAGGFLQRVQSLTGVAKEMTSNLTSQVIATAAGNQPTTVVVNKMPVRKENCLYLLVIDDQNTDWSKYFKTRRVNEQEIFVEQCEFGDVSVVSGSDFGCVVSYPTWKDGAKVTRQFQPDFILIRQNLKDAGRDYKNCLLALMYGGVPSVNSLQAVYNFQDKPWVFAHMMNIQRKHHNNFPLIEQYFYPDFKEMSSIVPKLPGVLKIGHAHGGLGKIRANNINDYQDASSVVAVTGTYCTSEPYVEARCDVHIQKIGNQYKAFMRKGIVGHWKSGSGSAMLEQVAMNERYKQWVDNVATLFGGLDICALEVIVGKDGREFIIEVNDSALTLMGESQEEDRRHIAELVLSRMQLLCKSQNQAIPPPTQQQPQQQPQQQQPSPQQVQQRYRRQSGGSDSTVVSNEDSSTVAARRDSQSSTTSSQRGSSFFSRQNSQATPAGGPSPSHPPAPGQQQPAGANPGGTGAVEDSEDTMKNLRKTFAGIFGDM